MEKKTPEKVNVKLGEIEVKKLDVSKYIGKKERIAEIGTFKSDYGYYLKVTSTVVDVLSRGKNDTFELRATRLFNLSEDAKGAVGWGKESDLAQFLALKGVKYPEALIGKEVIVQLSEKNGRQFLTFV